MRVESAGGTGGTAHPKITVLALRRHTIVSDTEAAKIMVSRVDSATPDEEPYVLRCRWEMEDDQGKVEAKLQDAASQKQEIVASPVAAQMNALLREDEGGHPPPPPVDPGMRDSLRRGISHYSHRL